MSENPIAGAEKKVESLLKSEPWYVWGGAVAASGIIIYFFWKRRQAATASHTSQAPTADQMNGYTMSNIAGLPYGAMDGGYNYQSGPVDNFPGGSWSETSVGGNTVPIVPSGASPLYDPNGNLVGFQQGSTQTGSPQIQPAQITTQTGSIRAAETSGTTVDYDKQHAGVPLRATPGGSVVSEVPYSSSITITGGPVSGGSNFASDPNHTGSTLWFPVRSGTSTGYVSAYDVTKIVPGGTGGGGKPVDGFHVAVNAGRNTVDQWTFANGLHSGFDAYAPVEV